jgi:hypothetical protein
MIPRVTNIHAQISELYESAKGLPPDEQQKLYHKVSALLDERDNIWETAHRERHPEFYAVVDRVAAKLNLLGRPVGLGRFRGANQQTDIWADDLPPDDPTYVLDVRKLPDGGIDVKQTEIVGISQQFGMITLNSPDDLPRRSYTHYIPSGSKVEVIHFSHLDHTYGDFIGYMKRRFARTDNLTRQTLREELEDYAREYGHAAARKLIEAAGVKSINDLKKDQFQAVFDACAIPPEDA